VANFNLEGKLMLLKNGLTYILVSFQEKKTPFRICLVGEENGIPFRTEDDARVVGDQLAHANVAFREHPILESIPF
jgi:hypothetical protein